MCGRPVDPLRARAVGIFDGQTRYFCSAECKQSYARSGAAVTTPAAATVPTPVAQPAPVAKPAAPAKPSAAAKPATVAASAVVPEPQQARPATPGEPAAERPSRSSATSLVLAAIAVVAVIAAFAWLRPRSAPPVVTTAPAPRRTVPAPVIAPEPVHAPEPVLAPGPARVPKAAPSDSRAAAASVPAYDGTLKLGLRCFTEEDGATWSLRLVLIDDAGNPTVVSVASGTGRPEAVDEAVVPAAAFARARREPGVVFERTLRTSSGVIEIEVERRATSIVSRSRSADGPWSEKVVAQLTADTVVRAAPFARARYTDKKP